MSSLLIVDDHPIVAEACRLVLGDGETIVAAHDVASGFEAFLAHGPDVVILDLSFPGEALGGVALTRRICSTAPLARILVFSVHADLSIVTTAIEAGAAGYLIKDSPPDELSVAVQQIRSGHCYVDERVAPNGSLPLHQIEPNPASVLSRREKEVLTLLGRRQPYPAIAEELGITTKAVSRHISQAKLKLSIRGPGDLLRSASELARGEENDDRKAD